MLRILLLLCLLLASAPAFALKPKPDWWGTPDSLHLRYQTLALTTPDHYQLAAWLIEPQADVPDQHTTMVVAGSDYGNMANFLHAAHALAATGYRVLLFDYRGFGHSQAFAINENMLYYPEFSTDLRTALAEARRQSPGQRVGIIGFSMGTIPAADVAASERADFLITDSYVRNPLAIQAYYQRTRPERPVLLPAAADVAAYNRVARRVKCPWLFVVGSDDPVTTQADSVAVAQAARRGQRRQVLTTKSGHMGSMQVLSKVWYGDEYAQDVRRFLAGGKG